MCGYGRRVLTRGLLDKRIAVGLLAVVGCFAVIGRVDVLATAQLMRSARFDDVAVALVWNLSFYAVKGGRLWLLIRGVAKPVSLVEATRISSLGVLLSSVYPGLGEAARFTLLRRHAIASPQAVAVVVTERAIDTAAVVALLVVAVFVSPIPLPALPAHAYQWLQTAIMLLAIAVIIVGVLQTVAKSQPITTLALGPVRRIAEHVLKFATTVGDSCVSVLRNPTLCLSVALTTFGAQFLIAVVAWGAFRAFDVEAPFAAALLLVAMLSLGLGFAPTPLGLGLYQVAGLTVLGGFTQNQELAIATATGLQVVNYGAALIAVIVSVLPVSWSREAGRPAQTQP